MKHQALPADYAIKSEDFYEDPDRHCIMVHTSAHISLLAHSSMRLKKYNLCVVYLPVDTCIFLKKNT